MISLDVFEYLLGFCDYNCIRNFGGISDDINQLIVSKWKGKKKIMIDIAYLNWY